MTSKENVKTAKNRPMTAKLTRPLLTLQQSPKISSNKFRGKVGNDKPTQKLFSLLDVNDKITNQRGTDMPGNYKRRTKEELDKVLRGKEEVSKTGEVPNNNKEKKQTKKMRVNSAHPGVHKFKKDRYLPKFYENYYAQVQCPRLLTEALTQNTFHNPHLYNISIKDIKAKVYNSDVFMIKPLPSQTKAGDPLVKQNNKYMASDIFYRDKNPEKFAIEKSGEKYFFNSSSTSNKFTTAIESNSAWKDKNTGIIKMKNLPSTNYNILSPTAKSITRPRSEYHQPANKTKAISEFIDLTRVPAPNFNPGYQSYLNKNQFTFRKVHGMCSDYAETFGANRNLCSKLFSSKAE